MTRVGNKVWVPIFYLPLPASLTGVWNFGSVLGACVCHDLLCGNADYNWRVRKLACSFNNWGTGYGLSSNEQHKVLVATSVIETTPG